MIPAEDSLDAPQHILILYLNTGNGHLSVSKALAEAIKKRYQDRARITILNAFAPSQRIARFFFETGYHFSVTFWDGPFRLMAEADCVVTKPGPSLIMEALVSGKPLIFSTALIQEAGNVRFVLEHNAGWFIKKPKNIYEKICRLAQDTAYYGAVRESIRKLNLTVDNARIADHIFAPGR